MIAPAGRKRSADDDPVRRRAAFAAIAVTEPLLSSTRRTCGQPPVISAQCAQPQTIGSKRRVAGRRARIWSTTYADCQFRSAYRKGGRSADSPDRTDAKRPPVVPASGFLDRTLGYPARGPVSW